jgi:hypothetical protein
MELLFHSHHVILHQDTVATPAPFRRRSNKPNLKPIDSPPVQRNNRLTPHPRPSERLTPLSVSKPELVPAPAPDPHLFPHDPEAPLAPAPVRWSLATRIAFRFGFCYLMIYALGCGNATLWEVIPFHIGEHLEGWTAWPFFHAAQWLGQHLFRLTGVGAKLHGTGSGDTILNWIAVGVMLVVAFLATLLWTALAELRTPARRTTAYPRLFFWFRLILRLTLGVAMIGYGLAKFFPLQMPPPSLAVLNGPLGNTSPMGMLWTLIGLNPVYEIICGAAEISAGILILFRRTGLLGELLTAFLATNIVLYNFCFDVPVKLYAAHLLLMSIALILPDMPSLFNFFFLHRPSKPIDGWPRPARRYGLRLETLLTVVVLLIAFLPQAFDSGKGYARQLASERNPSPYTGQWHLDSATLKGHPEPVLTGDGLPLTDIYFEPSGRTNLRDSSTVIWRAYTEFDDKKHTMLLGTAFSDSPVTYSIQKPAPNRLVLTPTGKEAAGNGTLALTRVPLPTHYPLLDRGFHFVNEWGLER